MKFGQTHTNYRFGKFQENCIVGSEESYFLKYVILTLQSGKVLSKVILGLVAYTARAEQKRQYKHPIFRVELTQR